jgi:hypothetical protein
MTRPNGVAWGPLGPSTPRGLTSRQVFRLVITGVLIIVVGTLVGLGLASLSPTLYAARVDIQYDLHIENASYFMRTDANLTGQQILLTDRSVLGPVAAANGIAVEDLTKEVNADIVDNSEILRLEVDDPDRATGVKLANAIADQYLKVQASTSPVVAIQAQLDAAKSAAAPNQARIALLQGQLDLAHTLDNTAQVVSPAYSLTDPVSPRRGLGAGVGALCGAAAAWLTVGLLARRWRNAARRTPPARPGPGAPGPAPVARRAEPTPADT